MTKTIYLAAASSDLDRAERWRARLDDAGITCTSHGIDIVRGVGNGNPRDASREQRRSWAEGDLADLRAADLVWFLVPHDGKLAKAEYARTATYDWDHSDADDAPDWSLPELGGQG